MIYTFPELNEQRKRMNAPLPDWTLNPQLGPIEKIREQLETGGIDVPIEDVVIGPGGLLTYEGEQVLLYIRREERRFHIMDCNTLQDMRRKGLFQKYVVTTRKDGLFLIYRENWVSGKIEEEEVKLKVCKNCLRMINWQGYADTWLYPKKNKIWMEFDIVDFFVEYTTIFQSLPDRKDTAPPDYYVRDWSRISLRYREKKDWICESCGVNLQSYKKLLHCHHRNGVQSNNQEENLQALCLICHSEQPYHHHMKRLVTPDKQALIEKLRQERRD